MTYVIKKLHNRRQPMEKRKHIDHPTGFSVHFSIGAINHICDYPPLRFTIFYSMDMYIVYINLNVIPLPSQSSYSSPQLVSLGFLHLHAQYNARKYTA